VKLRWVRPREARGAARSVRQAQAQAQALQLHGDFSAAPEYKAENPDSDMTTRRQ
jgi:hypothetical protein